MDGLDPQITPPVQSPDFTDEGDNSFEQMVALTTWVNVAVDQLNRGEPEAAILAKLSKDGCPDPQAVLDRALKQPFEEPEPMPTPEQQAPPAQTPQVPDQAPDQAAQLDMQRGSSVRIGDVNGRLMGAYASAFGQVIARIATDEGQVEIDVSPDEVEVIEETKRDPLAEIQKFIDDIPAPDTEHKASMLAYAENLKRARAFVASALPAASGATAQRLAGVDEALTRTSERIETHIASMLDADESAYLSSQPAFATRAVVAQETGFDTLDEEMYETADEPRDWDATVHEDSEILVMEADPAALAADEFLQYAASRVASAPGEVRERYMANVSRHRDERLQRLARAAKAPESTTIDTDDVPVEAIFL